MPNWSSRKRCTKCGKTRLLRFFYRKRAMPDGYAASCKECATEYARGYRPRRAILRRGLGDSALVSSRRKGLDALCRFVAREGHTWVPLHDLELLTRFAKREGHSCVPGAHRELVEVTAEFSGAAREVMSLISRFRGEAHVLASLNHPHVLSPPRAPNVWRTHKITPRRTRLRSVQRVQPGRSVAVGDFGSRL